MAMTTPMILGAACNDSLHIPFVAVKKEADKRALVIDLSVRSHNHPGPFEFIVRLFARGGKAEQQDCKKKGSQFHIGYLSFESYGLRI